MSFGEIKETSEIAKLNRTHVPASICASYTQL
jgi:hypothetical protein